MLLDAGPGLQDKCFCCQALSFKTRYLIYLACQARSSRHWRARQGPISCIDSFRPHLPHLLATAMTNPTPWVVFCGLVDPAANPSIASSCPSAARPQISSQPPHSFHVPPHNDTLPHSHHSQRSCHSHRTQLCRNTTVAALRNSGYLFRVVLPPCQATIHIRIY
ncbi:hypothetical protein DM02DRAFT_272483 [Periconia macrospinosa]|uniref:Uncharacterized protein n=1 Tax=Periconia macrospinosa TaxID=97972 RepID=A0A2V1D5L5_9PLEO|nr:hypothetical protein DM02DRAFT_272483 [Periconia macrospinosa]